MRWFGMLQLAARLPELLAELRGATPEELRHALQAHAPILEQLWRACVGMADASSTPKATESEWCRAADVAETKRPIKIDGADVQENFRQMAQGVSRALGVKNTEECGYLLSDLHAWYREQRIDTSSWPAAYWERDAVAQFFSMRKALLRVLKEVLKLAAEDPQCREVLKEQGPLLCQERRSDGRLIDPLIGYFGVGPAGSYRRNKTLRERRGEQLVDVLQEHRLVAQCLFYLARGSTDCNEWGVDHLRSLHAVIKDLAKNSLARDVLEFPKGWTIDEQRVERLGDDDLKKYCAELSHVTGVLCLTWWEAVRRSRSRGRGSSRDQDEEKLKTMVELARQDDSSQGFGMVLDLFLRVGLHQFVTNRTQHELQYVTQPWASGSHDQQLRQWHKGAFAFLGDVLTSLRVKAEQDDAINILRSLQEFVLHLVEKYIRPVVLCIGQDAEDHQGEPEPEHVRKLQPLLQFWAELCKCVKSAVRPEEQEWLDARHSERALDRSHLKDFLIWGIEAFTRDDQRVADDQRHLVTVHCFDHFCTVLGTYCCFETDVANELFVNLYDRGWWTSQQSRGGGGQPEQSRSITPVLESFERLLQQGTAQRHHQGLAQQQRVFCIASLRLLQNIVAVVGNRSDRRLDLSRWMKALVGMISLETDKKPELRVELFRTLSALIGISEPDHVEELVLLLDRVNLLDEQGMPAELNKHEARDKKFPVVRAFMEMMQVLLSHRTYWDYWNPLARPQDARTGSSPLRLLTFVRDDVLAQHFGGRLYHESGEKWKMILVAMSVLLELVQQPTDPSWMLAELHLVVRLFDGPGLPGVLRFSRENHPDGRCFEASIDVALKFVHRVLELRVDNLDTIGADHNGAFTHGRVMNLLGLIGYQYSSDIVLASACILTNLSVDMTTLPLASIGLEDVRDGMRRDFLDAVSADWAGEYKSRPSWVVLNLLLRQTRQWHLCTQVAKPALVHVILGWPASQDLIFTQTGDGRFGQGWQPSVHTAMRKRDRIAESDNGIIAEVFRRLDPSSSPVDVTEPWRETELCWELVRLLFADSRTHRAVRAHLTLDENRRFFDEFMDDCLLCWVPLRESLAVAEVEPAELEYSISTLYLSAQYMQILAVEVNHSTLSRSGFSVVDKLLAAKDPGGGDDNLVVITSVLDAMDLASSRLRDIEQPLDIDDPEPNRLKTFGDRGEELYSIEQMDLWWRRMKSADSTADDRHDFLSRVLEHNRFVKVLHATQQNFLSWKHLAEIIVRHKWAGPWQHNRVSHEGKVRRMLVTLLQWLQKWCEAVDEARVLHILRVLLCPLSELVAVCLAQLAEFSAGLESDEELMSRTQMLEIVVGSILASDHDPAVRGNLYTALLHLLWWCGVGCGNTAVGEQARRSRLSGQQQDLLDRVGQVLHQHAGITSSAQRSFLTVLSMDAFAGSCTIAAHADVSIARPLPWVQNLALSLLETIVRRDWEGQGNWMKRLSQDRFLIQILLPLAQEPQLDITLDPTPEQAASLYILEARLTLMASLAEAPPSYESVDNAVLTLLPRLRESWYFLAPGYLHDRHRMRSLLESDGSNASAQRFHNLLLPVLQTYSNLLVCHEDSVYALEQAVDFVASCEPVFKSVLDGGAQASASLPGQQLIEKLSHTTRLFQRVFQGCARQCESTESPLPDKCMLPLEMLEDYTAQLIEQVLFFFTAERRSVLVPEERAKMYCNTQQRETMDRWSAMVKVVRNVVSILYIQLKYFPQLRAPQPSRLNEVREFRAMGPNGAYAEWLRVCVEQLAVIQAVVHQPTLHDDERVVTEIRNLLVTAKMLGAILLGVGDRGVVVVELLAKLENVAVRLDQARRAETTTTLVVSQGAAAFCRGLQDCWQRMERHRA